MTVCNSMLYCVNYSHSALDILKARLYLLLLPVLVLLLLCSGYHRMFIVFIR